MADRLLDTIHATWSELSGCPTAFETTGVKVSVANHSVAPAGWIGCVSFGSSAVVAVRPEDADAVSHIVDQGLSLSDLDDRVAAETVFGRIDSSLGPAVLAFDLSDRKRPAGQGDVVGPLPATDQRIQTIIETSTPEEVEESAIESLDSGLFVALNAQGQPAAVSGYEVVLDKLAHIGVLTATDERNRGFGAKAAAAAIDNARTAGLVTQWRAATSNAASIALSSQLGLTIIGRQFSFRLGTGGVK